MSKLGFLLLTAADGKMGFQSPTHCTRREERMTAANPPLPQSQPILEASVPAANSEFAAVRSRQCRYPGVYLGHLLSFSVLLIARPPNGRETIFPFSRIQTSSGVKASTK